MLASFVARAPEAEEQDFLFVEDLSNPIVVQSQGMQDNSEKIEENIVQSMDASEEKLTKLDETAFNLSVSGVSKVSWAINGMDCPDCAYKATRALNRVSGVTECNVSASHGIVEVSLNLENNNFSTLNSVLVSLGHSPDLGWVELESVQISHLSSRLELDNRGLKSLILRQPGVLDVNFTTKGKIHLQLIEGNIELTDSFQSSLENLIGKSPKLIPVKQSTLRPDQWRLVLGTFCIPIILFMIILELFSAPLWILTAIGLPAVIIGGSRMFLEAFASIKNRQIGFQVLTSLAVIGAIILQAWTEALLVVALVALTQHLEGTALVKARTAMQGGLDRLPKNARLASDSLAINKVEILDSTSIVSVWQVDSTSENTITDYGFLSQDEKEIPLELLQVGDKVEVRSGELIPVDGIIIEGQGSIDVAPLTGESTPIRIEVGSEVKAGLVLLRGPVIIESLAVGEDTKLSELIEHVNTYRDTPPRLQSSVELFTSIWLPLVLLGSPLIWILIGDPTNWKLMLLLWVVACPCALLLAAPITHAAALANAARGGVIVRGGEVLETVARVNLALLDKTGTLTSGRPRLDRIIVKNGFSEDDALKLAAGLEARSNHPYADTIKFHSESLGLKPEKITKLSDGSAGVEGKFKQTNVCFGRPDWIKKKKKKVGRKLSKAFKTAQVDGFGVSLLTKGNEAVALFIFANDDVRDGASEVITDLYSLKVNIEILSGDSMAAVQTFGPTIGIPSQACRGEMSPETKARWVTGRSRSHVTMMAGDGFNDAAALAAADVGIAIGSAEQVNLEAADVLVPSEDPRQLTKLIKLSRKTRQIVIQNLFISIGITAILVWSVITGISSSLWIPIIIHEASAIIVILNGARAGGNMKIRTVLNEIVKEMYTNFIEALNILVESFNNSPLQAEAQQVP